MTATAKPRAPKAKHAAPKRPPPAPPKPPTANESVAALTAALTRIWQSQPTHTFTVDGLSVRAAELTVPAPHWHLVTAGLAAKGFELSVRCPRDKDDHELPAWVAPLLRFIAHTDPADIADGVVLRLDHPLPADASNASAMHAVAFGLDPRLGRVDVGGTPLPVLTAVALTSDELHLVYEWSPLALLDVLARVDPLLMTDFDRPSLLANPRTRGAIEQRVEREGSAVTHLHARTSSVEASGSQLRWRLSREAVEPVLALLRGRLGHQRPFTVTSGTHQVDVLPAEAPSVVLEKKTLTVKLTQPAARGLRATLKPAIGAYGWAEL
ncbi:MAG: suppressor of fused domain protein, partial [Archangium sp.]|nr:suppressor of fused domain protein [Archangium sp.]